MTWQKFTNETKKWLALWSTLEWCPIVCVTENKFQYSSYETKDGEDAKYVGQSKEILDE